MPRTQTTSATQSPVSPGTESMRSAVLAVDRRASRSCGQHSRLLSQPGGREGGTPRPSEAAVPSSGKTGCCGEGGTSAHRDPQRVKSVSTVDPGPAHGIGTGRLTCVRKRKGMGVGRPLGGPGHLLVVPPPAVREEGDVRPRGIRGGSRSVEDRAAVPLRQRSDRRARSCGVEADSARCISPIPQPTAW